MSLPGRFTLIPMYQSECSLKWICGALVSFYQWVIAFGILISNILSNAAKNRPNHSTYPIPIAFQFIWTSILASGTVFLPEMRIFVMINSCIACI
jgi:hypothetical protein